MYPIPKLVNDGGVRVGKKRPIPFSTHNRIRYDGVCIEMKAINDEKIEERKANTTNSINYQRNDKKENNDYVARAFISLSLTHLCSTFIRCLIKIWLV